MPMHPHKASVNYSQSLSPLSLLFSTHRLRLLGGACLLFPPHAMAWSSTCVIHKQQERVACWRGWAWCIRAQEQQTGLHDPLIQNGQSHSPKKQGGTEEEERGRESERWGRKETIHKQRLGITELLMLKSIGNPLCKGQNGKYDETVNC